MRFNLIRNLNNRLVAAFPLQTYCSLINLENAIRRKKHRISPACTENAAIHKAEDGEQSIYICRRARHNRYKNGVMAGVDRLAADYSLDIIEQLRDGTFIDCGANVGELGFWARKRGFRYIAFEPEELESQCVNLNHFDGRPECIRKALWKEETILEFFNRADSADSSVLPGAGQEKSLRIPATTLDSAVDLTSARGPVIFKLEAEGAEPEVLEGAFKSLEWIDWVAVDCGFERGPHKAHTFVETNTALQDHGFRLVASKFKRVTALYQRTK